MKYIEILILVLVFILLGATITDTVLKLKDNNTAVFQCNITPIVNQFPGDLNFTRISCIARDGTKQNFIVQN